MNHIRLYFCSKIMYKKSLHYGIVSYFPIKRIKSAYHIGVFFFSCDMGTVTPLSDDAPARE